MSTTISGIQAELVFPGFEGNTLQFMVLVKEKVPSVFIQKRNGKLQFVSVAFFGILESLLRNNGFTDYSTKRKIELFFVVFIQRLIFK